jgi:WbqC-like protein
MSGVVAIHQPNFFPWLGYFDKLARADVFVLLDHVQFQKKGGNWANRVQLITGGGRPGWVTAPVDRSYHGTRPISEIAIDDARPWRRTVLKTIAANYARAAHFAEVFPVVEELVGHPSRRLAELNETAIRRLAGEIGLPTGHIVLSSSLQPSGAATDLLIELVRAVGGDVYLSGGGAAGYEEPDRFAAAGIELRPQAFAHPVYSQGKGEFVPGLSVLDPLLHLGPAGTRRLLS